MPFTYIDEKGSKREEDAVGEYDVVVVGEEATGDADLVRVFRDQKGFHRWAAKSPIAERVKTFDTTLAKQVMPEQANEKWIEQMQRLGLRRGRDGFRAFAGLLDKDPKDEEVIRLAMIDKTPLTPLIFDPILLYDRRIEFEPPQGSPVDPRTSLLPVMSGFWPVLGWGGWDNRAKSARVFGLNVLCENNWFGGRQAWLIGFNMLLNLYHLNFDSITSSVAAF
jgi:hypothetical protein